METSFYIIILLLIFMKLMIWLCVFYARSRRRQVLQQRGIVVIQGDVLPSQPASTRDSAGIVRHEHYPGVYPAGVDNPGLSAPPSYDEVQRSKSMEEKPPAYEQIASYYQMPTADAGHPQVNNVTETNSGGLYPPDNQNYTAQLPSYSETGRQSQPHHSSQ